MDLDPWLSTLDTTSINPNINTSKTQTVSDNKPAAPVLINGRNVEKLREQHRDRPWTRARSAQSDAASLCFYISISSKQVISRSRFLSITWLSYREVEEMVVERLVYHRLQLETASECLLVFLTRLYLTSLQRVKHTFLMWGWHISSCVYGARTAVLAPEPSQSRNHGVLRS